MKNIFDQMSDKSIKLMGLAFAIALERKPFLRGLFEHGVLTAKDIYEFHAAGRDGNVNMIRRYLNKINNFIEDINP